MSEKDELNRITKAIIGAAIDVHKALAPGLLESAYEACTAYEIVARGMKIERQKPLPLIYKQVSMDCGYRLDLFVEDKVIVEIKAVDQLLPIHKAKLLSCLKLSGCKIGLLINYNVKLLTDGIVRVINGTLK